MPDTTPEASEDSPALLAVQHWVERAVIGQNLCPFARQVVRGGLARYELCRQTKRKAMAQQLARALETLAQADPTVHDTTLLVFDPGLSMFEDFLDFVALADDIVDELELRGELQIATFHPDYCFADAEPGDITNATNQAPYPTLHLLREASIEQAIAGMPDPDAIYRRNQALLRQLGPDGWAQRLAEPTSDETGSAGGFPATLPSSTTKDLSP